MKGDFTLDRINSNILSNGYSAGNALPSPGLARNIYWKNGKMSRKATMTIVRVIENSDASLPANISKRITTNELYPTVIKLANNKIPTNFDFGRSRIDPTPSVNL
ncbi:MAG: hypothetical protein ACC656_01390, partial [Candidatus Heimdallarchaeota archaeon]